MDFQNPFANYGTIVSGNRFIGRKDDLRAIESRVIQPTEAGNLAIIGLPKIGKSSLVWKALIERKKELVAQKLLPIWINVGSYGEAPDFFRSLVTRCVDEMKELKWLSEPINKAASVILNGTLSGSGEYGHIQRFFEKVRQADYRILFILDEFDHSRRLFKDNIVAFQRLRDLADNPSWRVNYVLTSRRNIRDIEVQTQASSTLESIFHKHYLGMFNDADLEAYFTRLTSAVASPSPGARERIAFYCGRWPYLLDMLGYGIVELHREGRDVNIDEAAYLVELSLLDHFERTVNLLQEDGSLGKLLQILFGPVVDVKRSDVDEQLMYGLIKPTTQDYVGFCDYFQAFLNLKQRQVALWPLWGQTEKALRNLITTKMLETYGEDWIADIGRAHNNLTPVFNACRERQDKEEKLFGSRASQNLIDFAYPNELFSIIFAEWSIFGPILGRDKNYWDQRAQLLGKVRTPLAHNRDETLEEYMRKTAEGYCEEILSRVQSLY